MITSECRYPSCGIAKAVGFISLKSVFYIFRLMPQVLTHFKRVQTTNKLLNMLWKFFKILLHMTKHGFNISNHLEVWQTKHNRRPVDVKRKKREIQCSLLRTCNHLMWFYSRKNFVPKVLQIGITKVLYWYEIMQIQS